MAKNEVNAQNVLVLYQESNNEEFIHCLILIIKQKHVVNLTRR